MSIALSMNQDSRLEINENHDDEDDDNTEMKKKFYLDDIKPPVRVFQYTSSVDKSFDHGLYTVYRPALTFVPLNTTENNSRKGPTPEEPRVPSPSPSPPPVKNTPKKKKAVPSIQSIVLTEEIDDDNEKTKKADKSNFFNYMHIPQFSANIKIDRNYGDERNRLRGATKLSLPAFMYQCVTSINNKTLMFGGLRSAFGHETIKDLEGTTLDNLVIKFNYNLPSSLKASVLTNPYMFPDKTFYIVNSSTLSFTVHQIRGDAPPAILSLSSVVISTRHVFYFGGFEILTVDKRKDEKTGKTIITKEIRMNEYGYVLDTITLVCHRIKFNASSNDLIIPRVGHAIVGTIYDDKHKKVESNEKENSYFTDSKNSTPLSGIFSSNNMNSRNTNSSSNPSSSSAAKSFSHINTNSSSYLNSNSNSNSGSNSSSNSNHQLYLNNSKLKTKHSFLQLHKKSNSPPPSSIPTTPTTCNFSSIGSPLSKTESNTSDVTQSSTISNNGTESSHSSSVKHLMENNNSSQIMIFVFGGFKLNEQTREFTPANDLLKIELCIHTKGTHKYYKFNTEALVTNLKPSDDDTEIVWPSPRGFMSFNIVNHKIIHSSGKPFDISILHNNNNNINNNHKSDYSSSSSSTASNDSPQSPQQLQPTLHHPVPSTPTSSSFLPQYPSQPPSNQYYFTPSQPQQPAIPPPPPPPPPPQFPQFSPLIDTQFAQYQYQQQQQQQKHINSNTNVKSSGTYKKSNRINNYTTFKNTPRFSSSSYKESLLGISSSAAEFLSEKALIIQGGTNNKNIFADLYWFEFELGEWFKIETFTHKKDEENMKFVAEIEPAGLFKFCHSLWQLDNYLLIFGGMGVKESGLINNNKNGNLKEITYISHTVDDDYFHKDHPDTPDATKLTHSYNRLFVLNLENQTWFYPKYTHNLKQYITPKFFENIRNIQNMDSMANVNLSTINAGNVFDNAKIFSVGGEYVPFFTDDKDNAENNGNPLTKDGKLDGNDILVGGAMTIEIPLLSVRKFV